MSEIMARRFGGFLGEFLEYDTKVPMFGILRYMRIKVKFDVRLPLKRKKKVLLGDKPYYAIFKYEKLSLFCFIFGKLGHGESFYPVRARVAPDNIIFGWDISLWALRRGGSVRTSKWLRQPDDTSCWFPDMERRSKGQVSRDLLIISNPKL